MISVHEAEKLSLQQIEKFQAAAKEVRFEASDEMEVYGWIERLLGQDEIPSVEKTLGETRECGLEVHPEITRIVYRQDVNRQAAYPTIQLHFLVIRSGQVKRWIGCAIAFYYEERRHGFCQPPTATKFICAVSLNPNQSRRRRYSHGGPEPPEGGSN